MSQNSDTPPSPEPEDFDLFATWQTLSQNAMNILDDGTDERLAELLHEMQQEQGEGSSSNRRRKKRIYIERNREEGAAILNKHYFHENPEDRRYPEHMFRTRFRMPRSVFDRVLEALKERYDYFKEIPDATGRSSLTTFQKCTAAIRMLAYGTAADQWDESFRIAETTTLQCLYKFVEGVVEIFSVEYLRRPNNDDIVRLLEIGEARGFPDMIGSLDCMHWEWKNCPVGWQGQFKRGDHAHPTIMLEAVASADLWIWHAYFGVPGCNNDLTVLNQSPIFAETLQGRGPQVQFKVNNKVYNLPYYLTDGIYPDWPVFIKTISMPQGAKKALFARVQESCRKDVERAFGVLQQRFHIISRPARAWHGHVLKKIMLACIILHNMIVEVERSNYAGDYPPSVDHPPPPTLPQDVNRGPWSEVENTYRKMTTTIRDKNAHYALKNDLIEHIWTKWHHLYQP